MATPSIDGPDAALLPSMLDMGLADQRDDEDCDNLHIQTKRVKLRDMLALSSPGGLQCACAASSANARSEARK